MNTSSLYGAETKASFDTSKSVQQQISDGKFKQSDKVPPEHTELKKDEQPRVSITNDTGKPADFTVKKDGSVEVHGNPESTKPFSEYKIAVEAGANQKVTDALASYLRDRLVKSGDNINMIPIQSNTMKMAESDRLWKNSAEKRSCIHQARTLTTLA